MKIIKKEDADILKNNDIYFWNGECKIIMVCTPAWYKGQCELLD